MTDTLIDDPALDKLLHRTDAAHPDAGDVAIQNYTINFGRSIRRRTACCV